jgi:uroporphyrinogen-III synthase
VSEHPRPAAPLAGRRILITRPAGQADALTHALTMLGATVIHVPLIRIEPPLDPAPLQHACEHLDAFDWIVVTSANAARAVVARTATAANASHIPAKSRRSTHKPGVCAVGLATAACFEGSALRVTLVAGTHTAEGVVEALRSAGVGPQSRVLFARGDQARDVVPHGLRQLGAEVVDVVAYRTVPEPLDRPGGPDVTRMLGDGTVDAVVFTSGSAVRSFVAAMSVVGMRTGTSGAAIACLGPVTADAAREEGLEVAIVASDATSNALADALAQYFRDAPR